MLYKRNVYNLRIKKLHKKFTGMFFEYANVL